jgi:aspartyl-tRNA(Asn)/glutamyl-tRNA(Gln) amidotransferase subunit A
VSRSHTALRSLAEDVRNGRRSAVQHAQYVLEGIHASQVGADTLNAFLAYDLETTLAQARIVEQQLDRPMPLAGVPVAIKDNICTLEYPTTCGSRLLEGYRSPYEATAIRKLKAAGAVLVGKTNMDEFAMGSSTENSGFGPTRNPHDRSRVPGGSSGGSAAAVAAGLVPAALGSETGGSVRQPAAFCGIVGIKPSYGRVSRYGLVAFASSLDNIGTFGRTVADAALLLQVISGADPLDSTAAPQAAPDFSDAITGDLKGMVVGVPKEYFPRELDARIAGLCRRALDQMSEQGAEIREVSLPHTQYAIPTYYLIATAEASANLARYDGVRYGQRSGHARSTVEVYALTRSEGFGAEVKRRIMLGTYALSSGYYDAYYARAQRVRGLIVEDFRRAFASGVDVLFTPTTPTVAFKLSEKVEDPYEMYLSDIFTVTANLAAIPGIALPVGSVDGLPVSGQFLAERWQEAKMIRAAAALERALGL